MIIRLVQLSIQRDKVDQFIELFEQSKEQILASQGCTFLNLLQDPSTPQHVATLSHWENEEALTAYRNSDFFKATWAKSKALFQERAAATSYYVISKTE